MHPYAPPYTLSPRRGFTSTLPTKKDPLYITTPIFYINGSPHIGHLYSGLLADCLARWGKISDREVFFMSGTDEHGIKVQEASAAYDAEMEYQEYSDMMSASFEQLFDAFDVQHTAWMRTTSASHKDAVYTLWKALEAQGSIYLGEHEGWYCKSDEAFVPDNNVERTYSGF
jgi:methionyl-tRNA synthetase